MQGLLWGLAVLGVAIGLLALRRAFALARDVKQLKREAYYTESRLKRLPEEIQNAVQPLRLQLASVADGKPVSRETILNGRLYLDVTADETQRILEQEGGLQSGKVMLVDVRTPREYAAKHAPGAKLVPFDELEARYKTEIPETMEKVFVYCAGGERSRLACDFLSRQGYTNLYNVQDGMQGWRGPTEGEGEIKFIQFERRP